MVLTPNTSSLSRLVDMARGTVRREVFVDEDIYAQELERVFARSWLFIGHESQIPNPNDFFVSRMGEESVIMTRDRQGKVHVLLNTCMHRGMKVCRYDEGNTPVFSCPYHGWSYSTDGNLVSVPGELIGVPQFATAYHGELQKENWGLVSVPQMHVYKGSVWACWDQNAPSWDDYMGDMRQFIHSFDSYDGEEEGMEVIGGVQKYVIPSAWMYGAENFIGDGYHNISHRSVDLTGIGPSGDAGRGARRDFVGEIGPVSFPDLGHGMNRGARVVPEKGYIPSWPNNPEVDAYFSEAHQRLQERVAKGQAIYRTGGPPPPSPIRPSTPAPSRSSYGTRLDR